MRHACIESPSLIRSECSTWPPRPTLAGRPALRVIAWRIGARRAPAGSSGPCRACGRRATGSARRSSTSSPAAGSSRAPRCSTCSPARALSGSRRCRVGPASVCFVETDRRAVAAIRANLDSTGLAAAPGVRVVRGRRPRVPRPRGRHALRPRPRRPAVSFDGWRLLLGLLEAELAVLESSAPVEVPAAFAVRREYRYGGTLVTLVEALGPGRDDPRTTEKDPV